MSEEIWQFVESVQPSVTSDPQKHPLESLRWASNADKYRFVQVTNRAYVDVGSIRVRPDAQPIDVVDEWRAPGRVELGDVVTGLALERTSESQGMSLNAALAHRFVIQIGEELLEWAPLDEVMETTMNAVLAIISQFTAKLGEEPPDLDGLVRSRRAGADVGRAAATCHARSVGRAGGTGAGWWNATWVRLPAAVAGPGPARSGDRWCGRLDQMLVDGQFRSR